MIPPSRVRLFSTLAARDPTVLDWVRDLIGTLANGLQGVIFNFCDLWPAGHFFAHPGNGQGPLAVLLVSLVCGAVGSLVVGNRMAFFSDALARCAFAGVALGLLTAFLARIPRDELYGWVTLVMIVFGTVIGL